MEKLLEKYWVEVAAIIAVVLLGIAASDIGIYAQVAVTSIDLGLKYFVPMYSETDGSYIYLFGYNNSAGVAALAVFDPSTQSIVDYVEYSSWSQFTGGYVSPNAPYIYAFANNVLVAINKSDLSVVGSSSVDGAITGAIYYSGSVYVTYSRTGIYIDYGYVAKCAEDASSCTSGYAQTTNSVSDTVVENFINEFAVYEVGTIVLTALSDDSDNVLVYAYEAATETIADVGSTVTGKWLGADYDSVNGRFLGYFFDGTYVIVRFYSYSAGSLTELTSVICVPSVGIESFGFVKYLGSGTLAIGYLNSSTTYVDYFDIDLTACDRFKTETVPDTRPYHAAEVLGGTLYYFVYSPTTYETGVVVKEAVSTVTVTTTVTQPVTTTVTERVTETVTETETVYETETVTQPVTTTETVYKTVTSTYATTITKGYTTTIRDTVTAWRTYTALVPTVYTLTKYVPTTVTETFTYTTTRNVTETVTETSPVTTTYTTTYTTEEPIVTTTEYVTTVTETYTTTEYYTTVVTEPWWVVTRVYPTTVTGVTTYVTTITETTTIYPEGIIVPVEIPAVMGVTTVYEPVPVPVEKTVTTTVYVPEERGTGYMVYIYALLFAVLLAAMYIVLRRR